MGTLTKTKAREASWRAMPLNVWAVSAASFFMDISSEMVINILPLFLANVLGVQTSIIGVIEGFAETTSSLLKIFSGWLSDKLRARKWLAVSGYALSAIVKPLFYFAATWEMVAGARWADRVGKGIRTAPRDALVADSIDAKQRGLAFGFNRAADSAGAMLGILIALGVVWFAQAGTVALHESTFRTLVLISIAPAFLAVLALALIARDVPIQGERAMPKFAFKSLGKPFMILMLIVCFFELGNSSDAFLVLRAQNLGMNVVGVLAMLVVFNFVYTLLSIPAGALSDRIGRRGIIIGGWLMYAIVYLGFALADGAWQVFALYAAYGIYYGVAYGTTKALVADLVPENLRGTAYGTYNAVLSIIGLPASVIAGVLWQGVGAWSGFGASAPFYFGAAMAFIGAVMLAVWLPSTKKV
jgi:MFS family permease